jgi:peroxiredoxin
MAVSSTMLPLGTSAPAFSLPDVATGQTVSLADFAEKQALLVMFVCAHCPYVVHVRSELARLARDYADRGVGFVAITANDVERYPQDAPEPSAAMARAAGWTFPFLYDASQAVAQAYTAACTPDFFLFDKARRLVYRGQLDGSRPSGGVPDGADLRAALEAVLGGQAVSAEQRASIGCGIKWKPGKEPAYS